MIVSPAWLCFVLYSLRNMQEQLYSYIIDYVHAQIIRALHPSLYPTLMNPMAVYLTQCLTALSSLIKCIPKSDRGAYVVYLHKAIEILLETLQKSQENLFLFAAIRKKVVAVLHHMIVYLEDSKSIELLVLVLPRLVESIGKDTNMSCTPSVEADIEGIEEVVQLINKVIIEYKEKSQGLVQQCYVAILSRLIGNAHANQAGYIQCVEADAQHAVSRCGHEPPNTDNERARVWKTVSLLVMHVSQYNIDAILYRSGDLDGSSNNGHSSAEYSYVRVLEWCLSLIKGFTPVFNKKISKPASLPLRRTICLIISNLIEKWLGPQRNCPPQVMLVFEKYLYDEFLPFMMQSCSERKTSTINAIDEHVLLNVRDGATQGLLTEIATVLYTLSVYPRNNSWSGGVSVVYSSVESILGEYLVNLLSGPGLMWQEAHIVQLRDMMYACYTSNTPLGTFRDNFRVFIRS